MHRWTLSILTLCLILTLACDRDTKAPRPDAAARSPLAAVLALDADGHMHPGPADRCPVCAMSTEDKKMVSAIELDNGQTFYFCGTGCMVKSWLHPEVYLGAKEAKVSRAVTTEFFTGGHLDATELIWVAGSDVVGPMGPMIVPLTDAAALAKFKERHGGKITFRLTELDDARWEAITGKQAIPDGEK